MIYEEPQEMEITRTSMVGRPLRPRLEQQKKLHEDALARVNRAIELLDKHPEFTEFLDAIGATVRI